jgi:hypothetical protein
MLTLKEAEQAIQDHQAFTAGNLSAIWYEGYERPIYSVRSYGVQIAECEDNSLEHRFIEEDAYTHSKTTSKHANIVKRAWSLS